MTANATTQMLARGAHDFLRTDLGACTTALPADIDCTTWMRVGWLRMAPLRVPMLPAWALAIATNLTKSFANCELLLCHN
jgi:hypothetical protein